LKLKSQYIETNGIRLHCKVGGAGKLLILLHGFPEFWYAWHHQIPALMEEYLVVVPDLRGFNKSDKPKGVHNYKLPILVKDIKGIIETFGQEKAMLVAHDWGAALAWELAYDYPEMVEKLMILNGPHPYKMFTNLLFNIRQIFSSWYIFYMQIPFLPEYLMKRNLDQLFERFLVGWSVNKDAFSESDLEKYKEVYRDTATIKAAMSYYRAGVRYAHLLLNGKNKKVQCPVQILWGEDDHALTAKLNDNIEDLCAKNCEVIYIPNCSHWIQHEQPELVSKHILSFLQG